MNKNFNVGDQSIHVCEINVFVIYNFSNSTPLYLLKKTPWFRKIDTASAAHHALLTFKLSQTSTAQWPPSAHRLATLRVRLLKLLATRERHYEDTPYNRHGDYCNAVHVRKHGAVGRDHSDA